MNRISVSILAAAMITAAAAAYADDGAGSAEAGAGVTTHRCVSYDRHDDGSRYCSRYED